LKIQKKKNIPENQGRICQRLAELAEPLYSSHSIQHIFEQVPTYYIHL